MQNLAATQNPASTPPAEPPVAEAGSLKAIVEEAAAAKTADEPLPETPIVLICGKHTAGAPCSKVHGTLALDDVNLSLVVTPKTSTLHK